jgi:hypothetical protein
MRTYLRGRASRRPLALLLLLVCLSLFVGRAGAQTNLLPANPLTEYASYGSTVSTVSATGPGFTQALRVTVGGTAANI